MFWNRKVCLGPKRHRRPGAKHACEGTDPGAGGGAVVRGDSGHPGGRPAGYLAGRLLLPPAAGPLYVRITLVSLKKIQWYRYGMI